MTIPEEVQKQAAAELSALPSGSALGTVVAASLDDRDKMRACNRVH